MNGPRFRREMMRWVVFAALAATPALAAEVGELGDLVYIHDVSVSPVSRTEHTLLTQAGTIDADGYGMMVLSLAFESAQPIANGGRVGAILIPDYDIFERLKDSWGIYGFPLEVSIQVRPGDDQIQIGEQLRVPVAFPRYQVFMYNETNSVAKMFLYVYRTRCGD